MKKNLLIVTEDYAKIQTYTGLLGNTFAYIYQLIIKIKLHLVIKFYSKKHQLTVLTTDPLPATKVKNFIYSSVLNLDKTANYKPQAWQATNYLKKTINLKDPNLFSLWQNKIASQLIYHYLNYFELLERLISSKKYSHVLIIGKSIQEQIAVFLAKKNKLRLINYAFFNLNKISNFLISFFRTRELIKKTNSFISQSTQKPFKKLPSKPVLVSVDFFRHLKTLAPVYKQLDKLKANPLIITDDLSLKTSLKNFQLESANYQFLASCLTPTEIKKSLNRFKPTLKKIQKHTTNTTQFLAQLIYPEVLPIINHGLALSQLYLTAGETLFKTLTPKYVVVAADVRMTELTLSLLAKKHHVPSITISPRTMIFKEEVYQYNLTDHISVTGKHAQQKLLKLKVPKEKIIINGDPRYDYLTSFINKFKPQSVLKKLSFKQNKKIVLLISDRPSAHLPKVEKQAIFQQVSKAVSNNKNLQLVIKPHPTEKVYRIQEELSQWGIKNAIISNNQTIELFELLQLSSVVIMAWSMTGLESMMLKKPVIVVNPFKKDYDQHIPYIKNNSVIQSHTTKTLAKFLHIYSNHQHPKTKALIKRGLKFSQIYVQKPDGHVALRIAKFILKSS